MATGKQRPGSRHDADQTLQAKPAQAQPSPRSRSAELPARKRAPAAVSTEGFSSDALAFGKLPDDWSQAAFRPDLAPPPAASQQPVQRRAISDTSGAAAVGEPGDVVQRSLLGGVVGGVVGGVGGMILGGPMGAIGGAIGGAAIGHALTGGEEEAETERVAIVGADTVSVRREASADSDELGTVARGADVEVIATDAGFVKIKGTDTTGAEITGWIPAANASSRARQLNQIATDLDADMDDLYAKSFNDDKTAVEEWGATIVEKDGEFSAKHKRTGHDGGSLPGGYTMDTEDGERVIGGVHSHPYSVDEGEAEGVAFSAGDINYMRDHVENGFQHWAEAGTHRFALVIEDEVKAQEFFDNNNSAKVQRDWNTAFGAAGGTFQEKVITAVKEVIGENGANGIDFYGTFDDDKQKFDTL